MRFLKQLYKSIVFIFMDEKIQINKKVKSDSLIQTPNILFPTHNAINIWLLLEVLASLDPALSVTHSLTQSVTHVFDNSSSRSRIWQSFKILQDPTRSFKILKDHARSVKILQDPS